MNNNHITIFVEMSDEDKALEQKLEQQQQDVSNKIDSAIKNQAPVKDLQDLKMKLHCSIRDLKGGVYADKGQRIPRNSRELAQSILLKSEKVAALEVNYINGQLEKLRGEMQSIKCHIESIISFAIENELDKKFDDFKFVIKNWEFEKADIFNKPERCEPAIGINNLPMIANNLIGYYIKKLRSIQFRIGELNSHKDNGTQVDSLISACRIVMSCDDDNFIFNEIFLMGQRVGNLNNIRQNIQALIDKERSREAGFSQSKWVEGLSRQVYLDYWIYGKAPTINEIQSKYRDLVGSRSTKTISTQMTKQRKLYSNIDNRVPPVISKGRNKKV